MSAIFEESDFIDAESTIKRLRNGENKICVKLSFTDKSRTSFKWVFYLCDIGLVLFEIRLQSKFSVNLQDDHDILL